MVRDIFDVVNERDEVVGRAPRAEVHAKGLMHRAVHVLVFNKRGEVFLQKRSMKKDRQPGKWDSSASGHVDSGEDYDACAARELEEEIGWKSANPLQRLFKLAASPETDQEHVWIYRCEGEGPFTLAAEEVDEGAWYTVGAVDGWLQKTPKDFAPAFVAIWQNLQRKQRSKESIA
jgi:isopentenyl-diphosphate Delta-isomerase